MRSFLLAGVFAAAAFVVCAQDDPPSRVARLNYIEGSVSIQPSGQDNWNPAAPNYPLTIGDHLWSDRGSRAELRVGSTAFRVSHDTAIAFLNLDDRMTQVQLSAGTLSVTVRQLDDDESYEVDTPNGAVSLLRPGSYRIITDPDIQTTTVIVRSGDAEVTANNAVMIHPQQTGMVIGYDSPHIEVNASGPPDDFDRWWIDRDDRYARRPPPRYVSPNMIGYEDLDDNGVWNEIPQYGAVWYPNVAAGWVPYRNGHWAWVEPWGWTWIDDAPWGFAPFHYGRWAFIGSRWGWVPGPVYARPVYAPALVAWVGGGGFSASVSFGGGGGVAWVPLGPREPYIPPYHVSNVYVNRVNMVEVTHINVTNVTNITYVNRTVPGAVVAVSRTDFAAARPVARVAVAVPPHVAAQATVTTREVPVTRQQAIAIRPAPVAAAPVVRPPQRVVNTQVVTKTAPPPATRALARPAPVQAARPAPNQPAPAARPVPQAVPQQANRPPAQNAQPAPAYRAPAQNNEVARPAPQQQPAVSRPPAQQPPAYRPPAQQETARPPQPQTPAARPPAQQQQSPQREAAPQREATPQREAPQRQAQPAPRPQNEPVNRPPAAQQPQQRQAAPERARPEARPEARSKPDAKAKEKEKEK